MLLKEFSLSKAVDLQHTILVKADLFISNSQLNLNFLSFHRKKHPNRVIIGHINVNAIRNKFDILIAIT